MSRAASFHHQPQNFSMSSPRLCKYLLQEIGKTLNLNRNCPLPNVQFEESNFLPEWCGVMIYPRAGVTLVSSCHASRDRVSLSQFIARGRGGSRLDPASIRQYDLQHTVHSHTGRGDYLSSAF